MDERKRKEIIEELSCTEFVLSALLDFIYNAQIAEEFCYEAAKQYLEDIESTRHELQVLVHDLLAIIEETEE